MQREQAIRELSSTSSTQGYWAAEFWTRLDSFHTDGGQRNQGSWRLWHLEYFRGEPGERERDFFRTESTKSRFQEIKKSPACSSMFLPCIFSAYPLYGLPKSPFLSIHKYCLDMHTVLYLAFTGICLGARSSGFGDHSCSTQLHSTMWLSMTLFSTDEHLGGFQ